MEDKEIIELYRQRNETAISETENKYGKYLTKIAYNILADIEDCNESVNDTYLKTWYSIPPHCPVVFSAFLAKITRQISIDIYRKKNTKKRHGSEYAVSIDELYDCAGTDGSPEEEVDLKVLSSAIGSYLADISEESRSVFICRYYFFDSIRDISDSHSMSESKVKSMLHRTRLGLKEYLKKEELI